MIIMWKIIILCTVGLVTAEQATFENYKVFKIAATTQEQTDFLNQAEILDGVSKILSSIKRQVKINYA